MDEFFPIVGTLNLENECYPCMHIGCINCIYGGFYCDKHKSSVDLEECIIIKKSDQSEDEYQLNNYFYTEFLWKEPPLRSIRRSLSTKGSVQIPIENTIKRIRKKCIVCHTKNAYYDFPGNRGTRFCIDHRTEGCINKSNTRCVVKPCERYASWGYPTQPGKLYCNEHYDDRCVDKMSRKSRRMCR